MEPEFREVQRWSQKFVLWVRARVDLVDTIAIPLLFFLIDAALRSALGMSVSDAGADMALLAMSAMVTDVFLEVDRGDGVNARVALYFTFVFLVAWIVSLWLLSDAGSTRTGFGEYSVFRDLVVGALGIVSFVWASALAVELEYIRG